MERWPISLLLLSLMIYLCEAGPLSPIDGAFCDSINCPNLPGFGAVGWSSVGITGTPVNPTNFPCRMKLSVSNTSCTPGPGPDSPSQIANVFSDGDLDICWQTGAEPDLTVSFIPAVTGSTYINIRLDGYIATQVDPTAIVPAAQVFTNGVYVDLPLLQPWSYDGVGTWSVTGWVQLLGVPASPSTAIDLVFVRGQAGPSPPIWCYDSGGTRPDQPCAFYIFCELSLEYNVTAPTPPPTQSLSPSPSPTMAVLTQPPITSTAPPISTTPAPFAPIPSTSPSPSGCVGPQPLPTAVCINGVWTVTTDYTQDTPIEVGTDLIFTGSVLLNDSVVLVTEANGNVPLLSVQGCVNITGSSLTLVLNERPPTSTPEVIASGCISGNFSSITVVSNYSDCSRSSASPRPSSQGFAVLLSEDASACGGRNKHLAAIIGGAVGGFVLLATIAVIVGYAAYARHRAADSRRGRLRAHQKGGSTESLYQIN